MCWARGWTSRCGMGRGLGSLLTSARVRARLGGRGELVSAPGTPPIPGPLGVWG